MEPHFEKTTVLGVGLIGASFALALKKYGLCGKVAGFGRTVENLRRAKERGIIDSFELSPDKACLDADLVVFATPVGMFSPLAKQIKGVLKEGAVVIDVGSVKEKVVLELEDIFGNRFVGCHPIAGGERSGIEQSHAELFNGALCIITKTARTDEITFNKIAGTWKTMGSKVEYMSPADHDRIYALVSHVPHLIAYALVNTVGEIDGEYLKYAGRGFKDMTRIASSSPELWRDICHQNKDNIIGFIEAFKDNADEIVGFLKAGDLHGLEAAFRKASTLRKNIEG